jgi:hypothetical protein
VQAGLKSNILNSHMIRQPRYRWPKIAEYTVASNTLQGRLSTTTSSSHCNGRNPEGGSATGQTREILVKTNLTLSSPRLLQVKQNSRTTVHTVGSHQSTGPNIPCSPVLVGWQARRDVGWEFALIFFFNYVRIQYHLLL